MTNAGDFGGDLGQVTPSVLSAALSKFGWRLIGGRDGAYSRWDYGDERTTRILVPLDTSKPDYDELLGDALSSLTASMQMRLEMCSAH